MSIQWFLGPAAKTGAFRVVYKSEDSIMALTKSSGNVFLDMGFAPAVAERMKREAEAKIKEEKRNRKKPCHDEK